MGPPWMFKDTPAQGLHRLLGVREQVFTLLGRSDQLAMNHQKNPNPYLHDYKKDHTIAQTFSS